jgi:flagellar operon protein
LSSHVIQQGVLPLGLRGAVAPQVSEGSEGFRTYLERQVSPDHSAPLRFSSHAQQRLESRGLSLGEADLKRLSNGVASLREKGVRDGLVVVGDHRFVVSAENRTVITVLSSRDREVFTNIQGVAFE